MGSNTRSHDFGSTGRVRILRGEGLLRPGTECGVVVVFALERLYALYCAAGHAMSQLWVRRAGGGKERTYFLVLSNIRFGGNAIMLPLELRFVRFERELQRGAVHRSTA